jgi:hypothetical protein
MTAPRAPARLPVEVVVPLRWDGGDDGAHAGDLSELTDYLQRLCRSAEVTVVDGSRPDRFAQHEVAWAPLWPTVRHLPPDPRPSRNPKVVGAMTGIRLARHDHVVLADDDVRYDADTLRAVHDLLAHADLVRPANLFTSWPWHARWDAGRSMLNRALAQDWPGTFGLRRETVLAVGGWDADVMFENLELVRTLRAARAVVVDAPDVLVARLPPTTSHFWSQRVRQAYDDLAQPWRLAWALSVLPGCLVALRRRPAAVPVVAAVIVAVAERGRRRAGADSRVPADVPYWAPLWVLERGVCSWLALAQRLRGGVPYRGQRLPIAAHSTRALRRRLAARTHPNSPPATTGRVEPWRGELDAGAPCPRPRMGRPRLAVAVLQARPGDGRVGSSLRGWSLPDARAAQAPIA